MTRPVPLPARRGATLAVLAVLAVLCALSSPLSFAQSAGGDLVSSPHPQNDPTRPDPDDGNQAKVLLLPLRDLALTAAGFRIGQHAIPWGTRAVIADGEAVGRQNGLCTFRHAYGTSNLGPIASLATVNRVFRDAPAGAVLASTPLSPLAAGATATSSGHLTLEPGTWMLYVQADAAAANAESDEANNLRRVRVTVKGDCR